MAQDILTDSEGNILIENGDFVIGDSEEQEIYELIFATKGDWKETPLAGFGVKRFLKGVTNEARFKSELKDEMKKDGKTGRKITFNDGLTDFTIS
ncbi:MAG: hypothetical protein RIE86_09100 [Imperialibacter sp.]|uniref:hypothetical protein n=1 Tax=Imperialibacter sp. TaxID=2038411 RepID=UPI0032F05ABA